MDLTVEGVIADETVYTLECRLWPRTNWEADPLDSSANWHANLCQTTLNGNVASCVCQGTGFIAIFEGKVTYIHVLLIINN